MDHFEAFSNQLQKFANCPIKLASGKQLRILLLDILKTFPD
jgi:hypothetical protein